MNQCRHTFSLIHVQEQTAYSLWCDRSSHDTDVRISVTAGLWRSLQHTKPLFCQQASSHTGANLRCPHSNFHSQRSSIVFSSSLSISTTKLSSSPSSTSSPSSLPPTRLPSSLCGCPLICLSFQASNLKRLSSRGKMGHRIQTIFPV